MSDQKLLHPKNVVKTAQNRCKSAQNSTKCWSISLKFGPKITCHALNLIAIGFRITSGISVVSYASYVVQGRPKYSHRWLYQEMLIYSQLR